MPPIAICLALALASAATGAPEAPWSSAGGIGGRSPFRHLRSTQPRTEKLLDLGVRRSPTFAQLRTTLEAADVIVYVQTVSNLPAGLDGRLVFLTTTRDKRYLRIDVRSSLAPNDLLSVIGHELQHAVEIAGAAHVRDARSMTTFYQRIGVSRRAQNGFDTDAAREVGARVKSELLGA